jgi:hypothetical protein
LSSPYQPQKGKNVLKTLKVLLKFEKEFESCIVTMSSIKGKITKMMNI